MKRATAVSEVKNLAEASAILPGPRLVLRRAWWMLLAAVLGLCGGLVVEAVRPAPYTATATLSVTSAEPRTVDELTRATQALGRIATAPGVVARALADAGQSAAAANPRRYVTVEAAPATPLLSVTGAAEGPVTARLIARTVASALARSDAVSGFDVVIVAAPIAPTEPTRPPWVVPIGVAALASGLAVVAATSVPPRNRRRTAATEVPEPASPEAEREKPPYAP